MALESLPATPQAAPKPKHPYRLRFKKAGDLRLVSHIDLLHVFERMLRRAELPVASTRGFHPKPCLVFAQALALGVAGLEEIVELELDESLPAPEVLDRLNRHAPPGLVFLTCVAVPTKRSLQVRRAFYRLNLAETIVDPAVVAQLPRRCIDLLAQERCIVERQRPRPRRIDIKPYLGSVAVEGACLTMALWITPYGAARPEEVVKSLGLGDLLDQGAVLERTRLELMEELPESDRWLPEIPRLADAELELPDAPAVPALPQRPRRAPASEPLVATPLSFET